MTEINVDELYVETVQAQAISVDWSEVDFPNGEYDRCAEPFTLEEGEGAKRWPTLIAQEGTVTHYVSPLGNAFALDDWDGYVEAQPFYQELDGDLDEDNLPENVFTREEFWAFEKVRPRYSGAEGPRMNYLYPCPLDEDDLVSAAAKIAGLPLCVVSWNGVTGFALTGGGQDLSWEIAEAFIRLGFLPPVAYAKLPAMSGKGSDPAAPLVLACMKRSLRWLAGWANDELERLEDRERMIFGESQR